MSRYIAPGTISSERDLIEYHIENAEPVDPNAPKGYSERCIHSEVLKRFKDVNAVIHSHSEAVVPYSISGVPYANTLIVNVSGRLLLTLTIRFQACFHMAGFLGTSTPVYEIERYYEAGDRKDMLVRNTRLGSALASHFGEGSPEHAVVLMRGHGFTVQGPSIMNVVLRAVYTQQNAGIQTTALLTRAAYFGPGQHQTGGATSSGVTYLSEEEFEDAADQIRRSAARPWRLWLREVEAQGMYVNTA